MFLMGCFLCELSLLKAEDRPQTKNFNNSCRINYFSYFFHLRVVLVSINMIYILVELFFMLSNENLENKIRNFKSLHGTMK